jgi:peptidoglycan/xylan/chitin deacetylase (PgdA/CDA1 family)
MRGILMYHSFGALPSQSADPLYRIPEELFRRHLGHLANCGSEIVDIGAMVRNASPGKDSLSLTIDDGDISILTTALPLLQEYRIPATVFLATGLVGTPGFLTWSDVRECRRGGISFQSHTHTHTLLASLSDADIRKELELSKQTLEDALGEPVEGLALPGGSGDLGLIGNMARDVGYRYVATSSWGYNDGALAPYQLERISWMRTQSFRLFEQFVAGDPAVLRRMKLRGQAIKIVKRYLGSELYEKFKRLAAGS